MSRDRSPSTARFIAVKIDVVASRRARDRAALQATLFDTVERANTTFAPSLASRFVVTHGDEVQGMYALEGAADLFPCLEEWLEALRPHRVRFGVGIGSLSTPIQPQAIGMDGACWHRAKEALDAARREHKLFQCKGLDPETDARLTAFTNILLVMRRGWTERQVLAVRLAQAAKTQAQAAENMGVSGATFSKHLSAAHWHEYAAGRAAIVGTFVDAVHRASGA